MVIQTPPGWTPTPIRTGNPDWDRVIVSLTKSVSAAVPHGMGQGAEQVIDAAYDAWPVSSGKSREALSLTYETTPTKYTAVLDDPGIPYATSIHGGETVADLLYRPAEAAIPGIVAEISRLIGKVG